MGFYTRLSMKLFGQAGDVISPYFSDLRGELKKTRLRTTVQEYFSIAIFTSLLIFIFELPLLSFIFSLLLQDIFFSFISAFTVSIFLTILFFLAFINYPKVMVNERGKKIDSVLPFATLYLSTISSTKLSLNKVFSLFSKFSNFGEVTNQFKSLTNDMEMFGMDVNTSLERAVERTPSKNLKEILYGILSVNRSGGDLDIYLKEKAKTHIEEYRRKLYEFSHQLSLYIEVYLTSIVLGAIFFTVLTAIISSISATNVTSIVVLQFLLIVVFLPLISAAFIILIKSIVPGEA
ncbi:MAG: type II secretion system F family protein [Candidatus Aenigmatarchaeota archaeon]